MNKILIINSIAIGIVVYRLIDFIITFGELYFIHPPFNSTPDSHWLYELFAVFIFYFATPINFLLACFIGTLLFFTFSKRSKLFNYSALAVIIIVGFLPLNITKIHHSLNENSNEYESNKSNIEIIEWLDEEE